MSERSINFLNKAREARKNDVYMCVYDHKKTMKFSPHVFYHHPDYIFSPEYRLYGNIHQIENALEDYEIPYSSDKLLEESYNNTNTPLDVHRYYIERIEHLEVKNKPKRVVFKSNNEYHSYSDNSEDKSTDQQENPDNIRNISRMTRQSDNNQSLPGSLRTGMSRVSNVGNKSTLGRINRINPTPTTITHSNTVINNKLRAISRN
jgi:CRISPR/Cas system CSM-associated protein Csm4 (group 5 of RAMP superfamily)